MRKRKIMTQAKVQETGKKGLKREFSITVPQDIVEKNLHARLVEMGKTVRIAGFRIGKIPMPILRQRFGQSARAEILDKTVSDTIQKTLTERHLRPASQPKVELLNFAEDKDLEFKLDVEVLPEITPADFGKITLERQMAEITPDM